MNLAAWAGRNGIARVSAAEQRIVVEHRDRFGSEYVRAAFAAQLEGLVVVDSAEVDDDLVRDTTEILTSMCARLYGKRAAENRAKRALATAADEDTTAA